MTITPADITEAAERINPYILQTPLLYSHWLSAHCKGEVYLKLENEQHTGSFKARGSLNKLLWMKQQGIETLPVTASTGNHGLGFARALHLLSMKGKIYLPVTAKSSKVEAIRAYDADLEFYGDDPYDTEIFAKQTAEDNGHAYVSPYNDPHIIAGQGTIGYEVNRQCASADCVLATVGGGGLISGIGTYLKPHWPDIEVVGCQPENSPEMSVAVQTGTYPTQPSKPTLSDGSAGGFERDSITLPACRQLVDRFTLATENEIANAIRQMIRYHRKIMEGAAGVAVAALLKEPASYRDKTTIIVICGANISMDDLQPIVCGNFTDE